MGTTSGFNRGHLLFGGAAMATSASVITSNQQIANDGAETVLITEAMAADFLTDAGTGTHFRVTMGGEISSSGSEDITITLRYGTTDILAITTVTLINEDDKQWKLVFDGRLHTTGSSGKVVAAGRMNIEQNTPLLIVNKTAAAGVTVDTTASGAFNVTGDWDAAHADADIIVMYGYIEFFH